MAEVSTIYLSDGETGQAIEAELRDAIEQAQIDDWLHQWQPAMQLKLKELLQKNVPSAQWPQTRHWNWATKAAKIQDLLGFRGFCVVAQSVTQGLARVDLTKAARAPSQDRKPIVYIDYLEVAPWNRADFGAPPRLKGIGTALVAAAIALSDDEGFKGRIGLHSLPQAESFYVKSGMMDLGKDRHYQYLRYFEMDAEQARDFLKKE